MKGMKSFRSWLSRNGLKTVIVLVFSLSALFALYPFAADFLQQQFQSTVISTYEKGNLAAGRKEKEAKFEQAEAYNAALAEAMYPADPSDALHAQYLNALKSENSDVMAVLSIPAIKVRLPVYHGTDDTVLHEGLGHLEGTDLPLGQKGERSFIAGHSGLINARMLDHLDRIEPGDFIEVDVLGEKLVYEVFNTETILPEDFVFPQADPQAATLVLVTCVPYGVNTHRLLVSARRVEKMPDENRTPRIPAEKKTPSAAVWIGIGLISLLIFACIYLRLRTR